MLSHQRILTVTIITIFIGAISAESEIEADVGPGVEAFAVVGDKMSSDGSPPRSDDSVTSSQLENEDYFDDVGEYEIVYSEKYLQLLREEMKKESIDAYVIASSDDHQSEYLPAHDRRRQFISHFTGSSGDVVVTATKAALWTDSRYFIQAQRELDSNWILMKSGEPETPKMEQWIIDELEKGQVASTDPRTYSYSDYVALQTALKKGGITFSYLESNLVDRIWNETARRPPHRSNPLIYVPLNFSGMSWERKVGFIRSTMSNKSADAFVVTALDDVAWLLNLRGDDILYTPVFRSYVIFGPERDETGEWSLPTLYLPEPAKRISKEVAEHLKSQDGRQIRIKEYEEFWTDLEDLGMRASKILLPSPFSYSKGVSYAVVHKVPSSKILFSPSPISEMKALKNPVEAKGMKAAHIRDGTALVEFLHTLETGVRRGDHWDELKAGKIATQMRLKQKFSFGPSFEPISAFGKNSALPHYSPTKDTNVNIDDSNIFMFDSGGQYIDGTTDVTRTVFLGDANNVTDEMKDIYTRLLMGVADLASAVFPERATVQSLEILIRRHLFFKGMNYGHGSTHGIGHFSGVHEDFKYEYTEGFFGSQEPGFYMQDRYGMRLENIVGVIPKDVPYSKRKYIGFETMTLAPYERKLINPQMMTRAQLEWVNNYHAEVLEVVGGQLLDQGKYDAYTWLEEKTMPIKIACGQ